MGPRVGGLGDERSPARRPRWRDRLERTWGVTLPAPWSPLDAELERCLEEWETGLRQIDFPEVTEEDRVTFLEVVVSGQVRRALRAGRFDLALALSSLGSRRVAQLREAPGRWRPVTLHVVHGTAQVRDPGHRPRLGGHAT